MGGRTDSVALDDERVSRLLGSLRDADFDAWLPATVANVRYATGHQYAALAVGEQAGAAALVTDGEAVLCVSAGEFAAASFDGGRLAARVNPYGSFHFASRDGSGPGPSAPDLAGSVIGALHDLGLDRSRVALDGGLALEVVQAIRHEFPRMELVDAAGWGAAVRRTKTPGEIERLRASAGLASAGIEAAIAAAGVGLTELDLMAVVGRTMMEGGGLPTFLVVTSGERSAYSDAWATQRRLEKGDLVRFDVGCTLDGYWSDVGRTAVVGEPTALQAERYRAIFAGEDEQLRRLRPGVRAQDLFDEAVATVESAGLTPYRRHHCGHAIGLEVYEPPFVKPDDQTVLEEGMVLCLETPFYELGWGGMMVEDTVLVTESGHERFTHADRDLVVITP